MSDTQKGKSASNDDLKKAETLVKQAEKNRVDKCSDIIYAALKEFDCFLQPEFFYRGGQWRDRVLVLPRQKSTPPMIRTQLSGEEVTKE